MRKSVSIEQHFAFAGPAALDLLAGFLRYDPLERFSAFDALVRACTWCCTPRCAHSPPPTQCHPYLAKYRDPDEEFVRNPIDTAFEGLELPVASWSHMLDEAIATMDVVQDGFPTTSQLSDPDAQPKEPEEQGLVSCRPAAIHVG
jgi:hypothetical protein